MIITAHTFTRPLVGVAKLERPMGRRYVEKYQEKMEGRRRYTKSKGCPRAMKRKRRERKNELMQELVIEKWAKVTFISMNKQSVYLPRGLL